MGMIQRFKPSTSKHGETRMRSSLCFISGFTINIAFCNEYLRAVDERIDGLSGDFQDEVRAYRAEAAVLRALNYYFAM